MTDTQTSARDALGLSDDTVTCMECGESLGQVTASHLSRHGMTMEEYRQEYPDAELQSDSVKSEGGWTEDHDSRTRQKISESVSGGETDADA